MRAATPPASVDEYLASLPAARKDAIARVREVVRKHLPKGYEEAIAYGMIAWQVPLAVYPDTYNKQPLLYASLASQSGHMALYLHNVYGVEELRARFEKEWKAAGKKLDMGKACVRFKRLDDVALDAVAHAIAATPMKDYVAFARAIHNQPRSTTQREAAAKATEARAEKRASSSQARVDERTSRRARRTAPE